MIPLNTPPGTEIVCIDDENHRLPFPFPIKRGSVVTLGAWVDGFPIPTITVTEHLRSPCGGLVFFSARRFRPLDLGGLDALLETTASTPQTEEAAR
ncbi:MAG: hypothetical protein ACR650_09710 [Methylocystis sp.]